MLSESGLRTAATGQLLMVLLIVLGTGCSEGTAVVPPEPAENFYEMQRCDPPVIESVTLSSATIAPHGNVRVHVDATDPNNDPLTYSYRTSCYGAVISPYGCDCLWTLSGKPGMYCIEVIVSDGNQSASEIAFVTVQSVEMGTNNGNRDR